MPSAFLLPCSCRYEGATVIEPKKAFYNEPIATLDFASLYPSIIQGYNLCYSTLVSPQDKARLSEDQYKVHPPTRVPPTPPPLISSTDPPSLLGAVQMSPSDDCFVTAEVKKGILPQILAEILAARKQAKRDMKAATDPMEKAVQNGRQLALKVRMLPNGSAQGPRSLTAH